MTSRILFGGLALAGAMAFASCAHAADSGGTAGTATGRAGCLCAASLQLDRTFISAAISAAAMRARPGAIRSRAGNDNFNDWGFLGGAQVGGNVQFNRLVLGLEGDFSWTDINNKGTDSIGDALNTNVQWTSTVTGRVGAAFDRLLVYGKGGLALAARSKHAHRFRQAPRQATV